MQNQGFDEEIDLREFVQIINKRKNIILGIFFTAVILAVVLNFVVPKTYKVNAVIQNGNITVPIMTNLEAIALLKSEDFLRPKLEKLGMAFDEKKVKKIISLEDMKGTNIFIIKIRLQDKQLALKLTQEIVNGYLDYGNSFYNAQRTLMNEQIKKLDGLIGKTEILVDGEGKNMKETQKNLSSMVFPDYHVQLKDLLDSKFNLESKLALAKEFKLIESPSEPKYPVSPKKMINLMIAGVLGLLLGILYAFILETYDDGKDGRK